MCKKTKVKNPIYKRQYIDIISIRSSPCIWKVPTSSFRYKQDLDIKYKVKGIRICLKKIK